MEIEKCPSCDGSGFAMIGIFRTIKINGIFKRKYLKFFVKKKNKEMVSMAKSDQDEYIICQHCEGSGYLYDRLPYSGPLDIGFCNFFDYWDTK